jgi:hypothetical protein
VAAEYVRVCSITVAGVPVVGFVLPGSDTCFKISGFVSAQVEGGNLKTGYSENFVNGTPSVMVNGTTAIPAGPTNGVAGQIYGTPQVPVNQVNAANQSAFVDTTKAGTSVSPNKLYYAHGAYAGQQNITGTFNRDAFGYSTRANLTLDAVSNTAYGPLVAHAEYQFNHGEGYDTLGTGGSDGGLNRAYVTWAGLTAGKANSFFAFTGGGFGYANFFSPDRQGFNQPDLVAYTASFGGGFAATISIESAEAGTGPFASGGSQGGYLGSAVQGGARIPDIVGALSYNGAWGRAQVSGLYHDVRAQSTNFVGVGGAPRLQTGGYAIDAGVEFNIPSFKGAKIGVTGAYSKRDIVASGIPDGVWGDAGQAINGNGQGMALGDSFANPNGTWATPTAWTITGYASAPVSPTVVLSLEGSYGQVNWTGQQANSLLSNSKSFLIGGVANYDPVKNLDFQLELFYQSTKTAVPSGYIAAVGPGVTNGWVGNSNGFAARLFVTRSF